MLIIVPGFLGLIEVTILGVVFSAGCNRTLQKEKKEKGSSKIEAYLFKVSSLQVNKL